MERLLLARAAANPSTAIIQADLQFARFRAKISSAKDLVETLRPLLFVAFKDAKHADPRQVGAKVRDALSEFGASPEQQHDKLTRHLEYLELVLARFAQMDPSEAVLSFYQTVRGRSRDRVSSSGFDAALVMGMKAINAQYILENAGEEFVSGYGRSLWQTVQDTLPRQAGGEQVRYAHVASYLVGEVLPWGVWADDVAVRALALAVGHTAYISTVQASKDGHDGQVPSTTAQTGRKLFPHRLVYQGRREQEQKKRSISSAPKSSNGGNVPPPVSSSRARSASNGTTTRGPSVSFAAHPLTPEASQQVGVHLLYSDNPSGRHYDVFYPGELFKMVSAMEEWSIKPLVAGLG